MNLHQVKTLYRRVAPFNRHRLQKYPGFLKDLIRFQKLQKSDGRDFELKWNDLYPCIGENTLDTEFDRHYIYHPAWAARILASLHPPKHIDISSTLHFSSLISAFIDVDFYDFRPPRLELTGLTCRSADLTALNFADDSVASLSCMHVVEHIGLGRYGDPLDAQGDLKAMNELQRILAPRGTLLFVVPLGKPAIMFNAHRIYSKEQILDVFSRLKLKEFTLIPEDPKDGGLLVDPSNDILDRQIYGCGCFRFEK